MGNEKCIQNFGLLNFENCDHTGDAGRSVSLIVKALRCSRLWHHGYQSFGRTYFFRIHPGCMVA
jgi:hypothetical protein